MQDIYKELQEKVQSRAVEMYHDENGDELTLVEMKSLKNLVGWMANILSIIDKKHFDKDTFLSGCSFDHLIIKLDMRTKYPAEIELVDDELRFKKDNA